MTHEKIFEFLCTHILKKEDIISYAPGRIDSITVKTKDDKEYIFTYRDKNIFKLETVDSFVESEWQILMHPSTT